MPNPTKASIALAETFNLRKSSKAWRGDCPRPECDGVDSFTLSFTPSDRGFYHAHCRFCGQIAAVNAETPSSAKAKHYA
jgi:hypothetical protein